MKKNMYEIAKNNYVLVLFLSIVIFCFVYIYNHDYESLDGITDTVSKNISAPEDNNREELFNTTPEIEELFEYIIPVEDKYTSYQSIFDKDIVTTDDLNTGDKLYIAYKYLEKTVDFTPYLEPTNANTFNDYLNYINTNNRVYYINTYITKENLNNAIKKIFNESLTNYVDFSSAMCYIKNDDYICASNVYPKNNNVKIDFVKAYKYSNKIEIIVNYKYVINNVSYMYFNSDEIGVSTYKVTFDKQGDNYYFNSSVLYDEN